MSRKALMSVIDAAGYAMAAPEEDVPSMDEQMPEEALRNGHLAAARKGAGVAGQISVLKDSSHWVRETVNGWWGGKAPA